MSNNLELFCRIATPFTTSGELDEKALRKFLQRFIKSNIGIYLNSGGGGESQALTWEEGRRIYEIGLEECRGKIPVYANPPEQYTVRETREYIQQAIDSKVEAISIYGITSKHHMKPTDEELTLYFKEVLAGVKFPMSLAVNPPVMGYMPKASLMADICNRHSQVESINLSHSSDSYFIQFKERLKRNIKIYVHFDGSLNKLTMGANGCFGTEANIIPKTQKAYIDAYPTKNYAKLARSYSDVMRYTDFGRRWMPSVARVIKMSMRLFKLPGWEGGLREPYRMPSDKEYKMFCDGLLRLGIPEIEQQARKAGVRIPK